MSSGWMVGVLAALLLAGLAGCTAEDAEVAGVVLADDDPGQALSPGPGRVGVTLGFAPGGVEIAASPPLEAAPVVGLIADAVRAADDDLVTCRATLVAPVDEPLVVDGRVSLEVVRTDADGDAQRAVVERYELDVSVAAGTSSVLPAPAPVPVDRDRDVEVACAARFEPA